ncbi:MAG: hypothetical protein JWO22_3138 [Frankiales bacterium]|nr:hypothetical protein [Frankiales bacterium]
MTSLVLLGVVLGAVAVLLCCLVAALVARAARGFADLATRARPLTTALRTPAPTTNLSEPLGWTSLDDMQVARLLSQPPP